MNRLIEETFQRRCIEQMDAVRRDEATGYASYLAESEELSGAEAPIGDAWNDRPISGPGRQSPPLRSG